MKSSQSWTRCTRPVCWLPACSGAAVVSVLNQLATNQVRAADMRFCHMTLLSLYTITFSIRDCINFRVCLPAGVRRMLSGSGRSKTPTAEIERYAYRTPVTSLHKVLDCVCVINLVSSSSAVCYFSACLKMFHMLTSLLRAAGVG